MKYKVALFGRGDSDAIVDSMELTDDEARTLRKVAKRLAEPDRAPGSGFGPYFPILRVEPVKDDES